MIKTSELNIIADTNFFLNFKMYDEIVWSELFPGYEFFVVLLPMEVIKELDNQKRHSDRRGNIARKVLKKINESAKKGTDKNIQIKVLDIGDKKFDQSIYGDDLIIEQVKYWIDNNSGKCYVFISEDMTMDLKSAAKKIRFRSLMDEDECRRPPELNKDQKRIKELEAENKILKQKDPIVKIFQMENESIELESIRPPDQNEIAAFKEYLKQKYPIKEVNEVFQPSSQKAMYSLSFDPMFPNRNRPIFKGINSEEIDAYKKEYNEWLSKSSFENNKLIIQQKFKVCKFYFVIGNTGRVTAENLHLTIKNSDSLLYCPTSDEIEVYKSSNDLKKLKNLYKVDDGKQLIFCPPPPPVAYRESRSASRSTHNTNFIDLNNVYNKKDRDDNLFYFEPYSPKSLTDHIYMRCPKLFPQSCDSLYFLYVIPEDFEKNEVIFDVQIKAENLPEPINEKKIVKLTRSNASNVLDYIKDLMENGDKKPTN